jgi:hypothetical protein
MVQNVSDEDVWYSADLALRIDFVIIARARNSIARREDVGLSLGVLESLWNVSY